MKLREMLQNCVHEINLLPHFEVSLDEIVKMNNEVYSMLEHQIRDWAKSKVPEEKDAKGIINICGNLGDGENYRTVGFNNCREQTLKNIEGE